MSPTLQHIYNSRCRPFDSARVTNESGSWNWIGNPQAILINGQGFYGDCQLFAPAGASTAPPTCAPSVFTVAPGRSVQQPWASNNNPGTDVGHRYGGLSSPQQHRLSDPERVMLVVSARSHSRGGVRQADNHIGQGP